MAIAPPAADRALIADNVTDRLRQRLSVRERIVNDLRAEDEGATARDQAQYETLGVALRSVARGYGFHECGIR